MKRNFLIGGTRKWKTVLAGAAMCLLLFPATSHAQNMVMQYDDPGVRTIDYIQGMPWGDGYLLGGTINPSNVAGYNNKMNPWGNLGRIRLQATDKDLNTQAFVTYVEDDEFLLMNASGCGTLNLNFTATDSKQTVDGGAVVCGRVSRNGEMFSCGGPQVDEPYILKVKNDGSVEWYKRYDQRADFVSIVQDPATKNYIVCGSYAQGGYDDALIMSVNNQGTFLWATNTPPPAGLGYPHSAAFAEVAPFSSNGNTYYAVVGNELYYSGVKNMLLTVVDVNGAHLQDVVLSQVQGYDFMGAWGVHDANDTKNIVITGQVSFRDIDGKPYMPLIMKIEPFSLSISFAKGYSQYLGPDYFVVGMGRSIIHGANAQDNIAVTGHSIITDWQYSSSFWVPTGMYLEVDNNGNLARYTRLNSNLAYSGLGIVNNSNTNYPAFAGFDDGAKESFAIRNNYGFDCGTDIPAEAYDMDPVITPTQFQNINISSKDYRIREFPVPINEYLACGVPRPAQTTHTNTVTNVQGAIVLSPNPVSSVLDIKAANAELKKVTVYDITGRVAMTQQGTGGSTKLDVSQLAAGTYLLLAEDKNGKTDRQSFVKE